jgi:hypothetical protein
VEVNGSGKKTLAYYDTVTIMALKGLILHAPGKTFITLHFSRNLQIEPRHLGVT